MTEAVGKNRFVVDTHALVWHLTAPARLGKAARRALAAADAGRWICYVPAVALIEIALLHERGRLRLTPALVVETLAGHPGYVVLAIDLEHAIEFSALVSVRDPMDRLVLAAARVMDALLVSRDEALDHASVKRIWD